MKTTRFFLPFLLLLFLVATLPVDVYAQKARPRVGLVLGGGGAKGAAHVGVLKVLEELNVPVHCIVGTSIGAIVGGLYATGTRADALDSLFTHEDWLDLFAREVVVRGNIEKRFTELLPDSLPRNFDDLPIPFRCVAVDIKSMKQVVFDHGSLSQAMRASMAIPGVLRSVKTDSMKLVDGGMLNNLPVDVARQMGANIIIAVDLQQNQHEDKDNEVNLPSAITSIPIVDWLLARPDWKNYNRNRVQADILINPDLDGFKVSSFSQKNIEKMIAIGRKTTEKHKKKIKKLLKKKGVL